METRETHPDPSSAPTHTEAVVRAILLGPVVDAPAATDADEDLFALGLDSLGIMQLLLGVEQRLGISVPAGAVIRENLCSIRAVCALIDSVRAARPAQT